MKGYICKHFHREDCLILICALFIGISGVLYPIDIEIDYIVICKLFFSTCLYFALLKALFQLIDLSINKTQNDSIKKGTFSNKRFIVLCCIYMMVLLFFYPGVNGWDTEYQLVDLFDGVQVMHQDSWGDIYIPYTLSDHMCLFDSLLFGAFIKFGMVIGNINIGVFIYCMLQAILFAFVGEIIISRLEKWGISDRVVKLSFLFFALTPFIWMYSINMLKDSINAALFALYFLFVADILNRDQKFNIRFFALSLLVCLTKKTGILIVVPTNVILSLVIRKSIKTKEFFVSLVISFSPIIIISIFLQKIIYPTFSIYQDGFIETFGSVFQQIGRIVKYYSMELSPNEINKIDAVLDYNNIADLYNYNCVDYVRNTYRIQSTTKDLIGFLGVWFSQFFKHPFEYLRSLVGTNGGFFSPTHNVNIYTNWNDWGNLGVMSPTYSTALKSVFASIYEYICDMPILEIAFKTFIYSWIIPCFSVWKCIKEKSLYLLVLSVPILCTIMTLFLTPVVNSRYPLNLIIIAPILLCINSEIFNSQYDK